MTIKKRRQTTKMQESKQLRIVWTIYLAQRQNELELVRIETGMNYLVRRRNKLVLVRIETSLDCSEENGN